MRPPSKEEANFSRFFFAGVTFRIALTIGVMTTGYLGAGIVGGFDDDWGPLLGAIVGLGVGFACARLIKNRYDPLNRD